MIDELRKRLNLLRQSPSFAIKALPDGSGEVAQPKSIPDDDAQYWVSGTSLLPCGTKIPSVFVIERGGAVQVAVHWFVGDSWLEPSDERTLPALQREKSDVFPFDWEYSIPVENDAYHG